MICDHNESDHVMTDSLVVIIIPPQDMWSWPFFLTCDGFFNHNNNTTSGYVVMALFLTCDGFFNHNKNTTTGYVVMAFFPHM